MKIETDCQKFKNKIIIKRKIKIKFEKLLIVFFWGVFFWSTKTRFILFSHCFFFQFFFLFAQTIVQTVIEFFVYNNNISFRNQIFFVLSFYIYFAFCIRHTKLHSKIIYSCFHSEEIYFETILWFFFLSFQFFFPFLSLFWCWKFSVARCFFLFSNFMILIENIRIWCFFMLSFFRKKNSSIRFFVFHERCFALKFFYFLFNQKIFFRCIWRIFQFDHQCEKIKCVFERTDDD